MAPNFQQLNVFWGTNNEKNYADLEAMLPGIGFSLRHELTQLRVMGVVPRILFIKDKHYNAGSKVDYLLTIADYGEDYVPTPLPSEFKSEPIAETSPLSPHQEGAETSASPISVEVEETMPVMRQDIMNLDHETMLNKIRKSLKKSRALHRFQPNLIISSEGNQSYTGQSLDPDVMTKEQRKDAMAKFILDRKILREKKSQNKYKSELNYPFFEHKEATDDYDHDDFKVEDYIDEEDFEDQKYS